jgi:hypothetical protein
MTPYRKELSIKNVTRSSVNDIFNRTGMFETKPETKRAYKVHSVALFCLPAFRVTRRKFQPSAVHVTQRSVRQSGVVAIAACIGFVRKNVKVNPLQNRNP